MGLRLLIVSLNSLPLCIIAEDHLDIKVTDFRVAAEVIPFGEPPSPASGFTANNLVESEDDNPRIVWLLEPMRTENVEKWSGTTQFPAHKNLVGDTLSTFTHFGYEYTHHAMVFADLQSKSILEV
jgi:hypothetical protein